MLETDGYRTQSPDTSRWADELQFDGYSRMESWEKVEIIQDLIRTADGLAILGIRERHPESSEEEVGLHLAALKYGRDLMVEFFGWDPEVRGW